MALNATPDPVHLPHFDAEVRLGKKGVKKDARNLKLASYLPSPSKLPVPPSKVQRSQLVPGYPMYGNDRLSDCTIATVGHILQLAGAASGAAVTPTDQQMLEMYWATGDPPTPGADDNGRFCLDVLNYWRKNGVPGYAGGADDLLAFLQINTKNHLHMKLAIWEFGAVYTGIALPLSAQTQRSYWKPVSGSAGKAGSWGGHAVPLFDYSGRRLNCCTWATIFPMTWGFWDRYGDEAYVPLTRSWFNKAGDSPLGVKLDKLLADLKALGINV